MVNWNDPATKLYCGHAAAAVANISIGIFLWDCAVSFGFDWQILTRRRPFRWTQAPYLIARYTYGLAMIILMITSNLYSPIPNCKEWWIGFYSTLSASLLASIGLLIIRVVAISGFSPSHIYFFAIYWLAEAGAMIYGITLVEGAYVPELLSCTPTHTSRTVRFAILMCFMLYIICLVRLAFSLLRTRGLGLWRVLLSQGIIHFVVVTIVFSSTSTLILLDLNDGMNLIFEILAAASLVICSTRLYRGLVMYNASEPDGFISTQTTLACKVYTPSAHQEGQGMGLPRSFAEYSTAEEGLAFNSASALETASCNTSGAVGACV